MEIHRKPTATDSTINNNSCHPKEQKLAAYKNWIHRLHTLPLNANNKNKEVNTIINIGLNNGYKKTSYNCTINSNYGKTIRKTQPENNKNGSPLHTQDITYGKLQFGRHNQKTTKMGLLYIHRTLHMESYKALQRHQYKNSI
jgi:hypothetical protein